MDPLVLLKENTQLGPEAVGLVGPGGRCMGRAAAFRDHEGLSDQNSINYETNNIKRFDNSRNKKIKILK